MIAIAAKGVITAVIEGFAAYACSVYTPPGYGDISRSSPASPSSPRRKWLQAGSSYRLEASWTRVRARRVNGVRIWIRHISCANDPKSLLLGGVKVGRLFALRDIASHRDHVVAMYRACATTACLEISM